MSTTVSRRRLLQIGASSFSLLALAACGGTASVASPSGAAPSSTAASPAASAKPAASTAASTAGSSVASAAASAKPAASGSAAASAPASAASNAKADPAAILRYGMARVESLDPIHIGVPGTENPVLNSIYDTLLSYNPDGTITPRLATAWTVMPDRVRLTLRQGVTFQDGTPFNADAVKAHLDRALNDSASTIKTTVPMLGGATVVDPQTVDLMLKAPQPQPLLEQLTDRAGMIASPAAVQKAGSSDAFSKAPVGAGMYKINGDWHPRESVSTRAWPGYWDKASQTLGGIDFSELQLNEIVNDIRAGSIDFLAEFQATDQTALKSEPKLTVYTLPPSGQLGLDFNMTLDPFQNLMVRQAIAYAIDRDAMVKAMTAGLGKPAYQPFFPNSPAYTPDLENRWKFD
ncbi:MAG: hypothetical protein JO247_10035, partial [Chloroflexi bacterium]|nr:hypothetical protein [Chloroflexota bacterium]